MEVLVEFVIMSEYSKLLEKSEYFIKSIPNCKFYYFKKGEYKKYTNGKLSKLPMKNSILKIVNEDSDYNNTIIQMLTVYNNLLYFFNSIDHEVSINISFFSNDMFSLEFGVEVLGLLNNYSFSLPISCYQKKNINENMVLESFSVPEEKIQNKMCI